MKVEFLLSTAVLLDLLGFLILVHQKIRFGSWIDKTQMWHHDVAVFVLFAFSAGMLLGCLVMLDPLGFCLGDSCMIYKIRGGLNVEA